MTVRAVVWAVTIGLAAAVSGIFYCHPPAQPSDWASWASAIGTVAAVFAAVWATFAAEDRQHRDAVQSARITASTVAVMIQRLAEEAEDIEATLENLAMNGRSVESTESLSIKLEHMKGPTEEQLLRLAFAPGKIGLTIATAFGKIQSAADVLAPNPFQEAGYIAEQWVKDAARDARPIVHSARRDFQGASDEIAKFLDLTEVKG